MSLAGNIYRELIGYDDLGVKLAVPDARTE